MSDQVLCLLVTLMVVLFGVWVVLRVDSRRNDQLIAAFVRIRALERTREIEEGADFETACAYGSSRCLCSQCDQVRRAAYESVRRALEEERPTEAGIDEWIQFRFGEGGFDELDELEDER